MMSQTLSEPSEHGGVTMTVACSPGGHLDVLIAVREAFSEYAPVWALPAGVRLNALRESGERAHEMVDFRADRRRLPANVRDSVRLLLDRPPTVVVTSGAGLVVPYCLFAWLLGARLVFVETMARVQAPSATGRLLGRLADVSLVQWPQLVSALPRAVLCRPVLLEGGVVPDHDRAGTLVALGTHGQGFERLLRAVDRAAGQGLLPEPIIAQVGRTGYQAENFETRPWIPGDEMNDRLRTAECVICHAGAGVISSAIRAGRRPMVMARRAYLSEHTDDHQLEIVDALAALDLVVALHSDISAEQVRAASRPAPAHPPLAGVDMVTAMRSAIAEVAGRPPRGRHRLIGQLAGRSK